MRTESEADVLRSCLIWLALRGVFVWRCNSGAAFAYTQRGKRRFIRFASEPGLSDIIGLLPPSGRLLAVETKRPGGPGPTLEQRSFLDRVEQLGGVALVVRSVEDLQRGLATAGWPGDVQTSVPGREGR